MQDIPKLLTALAEWGSCLTVIFQYNFYRKKKLKGRKLIYIFAGLLALCQIQIFCGTVSNWLWLLGMAAAIAVMGFILKYVLEMDSTTASFETAGSFLKAEFVAALEWQIYTYYAEGWKLNGWIAEFLFAFIVYGLCYFILFIIERKIVVIKEEFYEVIIDMKQLFPIWSAAVLFFAFSNLSYVQVQSPFSGSNAYDIFNIRTIVDLAGVFMFELFRIQKISSEHLREMDKIKHILKLQYTQYKDSQDNINLINQKYHDLKHQLTILRNEKDDEKRKQYLDDIESGIMRYEYEFNTGNSVLDTILVSKGQLCLKWKIHMTVVADGRLLNKIHVMDICTIFGNALDNAIEHEIQIKKEDQRMIRVNVSQKGSFICILIENYYMLESNTEQEKGFLKTTKEDERYHGFGVRSIRYSVKKYGGYTNINVQDHWFRVEIIIPI